MSEQNRHPDTSRGAVISDHPHPRPLLRRVMAVLVALGLIGEAVGVVGLLILGVGLKLPLLPLMAFFLATLAAPLLLLTVLHPRVTVYESGLWIKPLLWPGCWIAWEAITRLEDHTLIQRGARTRWETPHEGQLIVVGTGLPRLSVIVGVMAGLGRARAFGISTHSHTDYKALLNVIKRNMRRE